MTAPGASRGATEWAIEDGVLLNLLDVTLAAERQSAEAYRLPVPLHRLRRMSAWGHAAKAALAARPSPRDGGAAGEVERLVRERDEARDDLAEWMKHVEEVNAHAGRMQDKATAAESRAEAAEREAAKLIAAASYAPHPDQPSGVYGPNDIQRAFKAGRSQHAQMVAAQLGAAAREGGASLPLSEARNAPFDKSTSKTPFHDLKSGGSEALSDTETTGTTPSAEDGHGRG